MFHEAETWVAIAFLVFVALLAYLGVHKQIVAALDNRANKIKAELDEAKKLKDEAMALLTQYQKKRQEAETEAQLQEFLAVSRRGASCRRWVSSRGRRCWHWS